MDTLAIIKRIELRIAELGLTKADFYKQSGISSASYSQWNTGKYNPTDCKLQKAAEVLGVSFEYLRYGKKEKAPADNGKRSVSDDDIKFALFRGREDITDEMYQEVLGFADYIMRREEEKKKKE